MAVEAIRLRDSLPSDHEGSERAAYFLEVVAGQPELLQSCLELISTDQWANCDLADDNMILEAIVACETSDLELLERIVELYQNITRRNPHDAVLRLVKRWGQQIAAHSATRRANSRITGSLKEVAHEMRNQVAAIVSYTSLLSKKCRALLDDRQYRNVKILSERSEELLTLLKDVVRIAEENRCPPVRLSEHSEELLALLRDVVRIAEEKGFVARKG